MKYKVIQICLKKFYGCKLTPCVNLYKIIIKASARVLIIMGGQFYERIKIYKNKMQL